MTFDIPGFTYAAFVAGGGLIGYIKSNSLPSLGAGLFFGSLLGFGAYQISQDPHNYKLMLGSSASLATIMGLRYYQSQKLMPAGIIAIISVQMVIRVLYRHFTLPYETAHIKQ